MNKSSLAKRVGNDTRKVMRERSAKQLRENRTAVLNILEAELKRKANNGEELFSTKASELDIKLDLFKPMGQTDAQRALIDIGFEINEYPMCMLVAIPMTNVSKEVQELLQLYDQTLEMFVKEQEALAQEDCAEVIQKLENGEYKVDDIDRVTIEIISISTSERYVSFVKEMMDEKGFSVTINDNNWKIRVS